MPSKSWYIKTWLKNFFMFLVGLTLIVAIIATLASVIS